MQWLTKWGAEGGESGVDAGVVPSRDTMWPPVSGGGSSVSLYTVYRGGRKQALTLSVYRGGRNHLSLYV